MLKRYKVDIKLRNLSKKQEEKTVPILDILERSLYNPAPLRSTKKDFIGLKVNG